jgi:uncharacterized protein (DUF58 family)
MNTKQKRDTLLQELHQLELRTRRLVATKLAGAYRSAFKGSGLEVDQERQYEYGDDVRTIDWNVWARTGELHVKVFREERELSVLTLLDVSGSQDFGPGSATKMRIGAELAALLGLSAQMNSDRFGLAAFSDQLELFQRPRKGRTALLQSLYELLALSPASARTDLNAVLRSLQRLQRQRSLIFLISDFIDKDYEQALIHLNRRHEVVLLRLFHPMEQLPAGLGLLPMRDAESGEVQTFFTGFRWRRQRSPRPFRNVEARLEDLQRRYGIEVLHLDVTRDYVPALRAFFEGYRMPRG